MSKVTVLVAVYNSAGTLGRCIDSLLCQTHSDIQAICVDDGSTDESLSILHAYADSDQRIEVMALGRNCGQAHARNEALRHAEGEYITFLDSDDWLAPDAIEQAVETFKKAVETDCVLFKMVRYYPQSGATAVHSIPYKNAISGREAFIASLTWRIHGSYVVRADIHKRYPYDESCRAYSDDNTTRIHYLMSRKVNFCSGTYFYCQSPKSVTHSVSMLRFEYIKANESMKRQLRQFHIDAAIMSLYETQRWLILIDTYMFYFQNRSRLSYDDRREALAEMRRVWYGIETSLVDGRIRRKFGYVPFKNRWPLFRFQEECYFTLRFFRDRFKQLVVRSKNG